MQSSEMQSSEIAIAHCPLGLALEEASGAIYLAAIAIWLHE